MPFTRILWGQIVPCLAIVLIATWSATEWTAWRLGFQAALGAAWFTVSGIPFYPPPAFFWWWFGYDAYPPDVFTEGAYIAASGGILSVIAAITLSVMRAREKDRAIG